MERLIDADKFLDTGFDYILDCRSPREYNESHIPGSLNFYVLNNEEHHEIGHMYKNTSKPGAKKQAVIYMLRNISVQLAEFNPAPGSRILVYCARGGKRSTALYTILSQLDLIVYKLKGGYKAYRKFVVEYLQNFPHKKFTVLRGNSGCGKSELIERLSPSLDLEKLANHYGSNFGFRGIQPSQKQFENNIVATLLKIPPEDNIFIEAESRKIGSLFVPNLLAERIKNGVQVEITAPLEQRVQRILSYYGNIKKDDFLDNLEKIKKFVSNMVYDEIKDLYEKGELEKVAEILLVKYYDRVYKKADAGYCIDNTDPDETLKKLKNLSFF